MASAVESDSTFYSVKNSFRLSFKSQRPELKSHWSQSTDSVSTCEWMTLSWEARIPPMTHFHLFHMAKQTFLSCTVKTATVQIYTHKKTSPNGEFREVTFLQACMTGLFASLVRAVQALCVCVCVCVWTEILCLSNFISVCSHVGKKLHENCFSFCIFLVSSRFSDIYHVII